MGIAALKEEAIRQFAIKIGATDNEQVLKAIIDFLNGIPSGDDDGLNLSRHYDGIKARYGSTLKKLAE